MSDMEGWTKKIKKDASNKKKKHGKKKVKRNHNGPRSRNGISVTLSN